MKSKGKEIVIANAPAPKRGQVIDIMEALKRSMERIPAKKTGHYCRGDKEEKDAFVRLSTHSRGGDHRHK